MGSQRCRKAFTLVELLCVIAIIGLLGALALPVLSKAEGKGRQTACLNNLRQLQLAWLLYSEDHGDEMAPNQSSAVGSWADPLGWAASPGSWVVGNPQLDTSAEPIREGVLYPYTLSPGPYRCPADRARTRTSPQPLRNRSYALDIFLNGTTPFWGNVRTKFAQITTPAGVFGFAEVLEAMINGCDFGVSSDRTWYDIPADRHRGALNLSYLDGHAAEHRWQHPKTGTIIGTVAQGQSDLQDLQWLQQQLPSE